jgi:hypothetical protein
MDTVGRPDLIPELETIRARAFATRADVVELAGQVTNDLFNERPDPDRWSMCECIDHLVVSGEKILDQIDISIERGLRAGHHGRPPFQYGALGNWFVRMNSAEVYPPKRRVKTPSKYLPHREQDKSSLVISFSALQDNFVERVEACDGLHLARIKAVSPVSRLIRLSLGQWLQLVVGHEERHIKQALIVRGELADRA